MPPYPSSSTSSTLDPTTCPLPGVEVFGGDAAAHRAWLRENLVPLIGDRSDINASMVAESTGCSVAAVGKWFRASAGCGINAYKRAYGVRRHVAQPVPPSAATLAGVPRLHHDLSCFDQTPATVVVDLRDAEAILRRPAAEVLSADPSDHKVWGAEVAEPEGYEPEAGAGTRWQVQGYGVGTNKTYTASVLTLTLTEVADLDAGSNDDVDDFDDSDGEPAEQYEGEYLYPVWRGDTDDRDRVAGWRLAVLVSGRAHGRFSTEWAEETVPLLLDAMRFGNGKKAETRANHLLAQVRAHRSAVGIHDAFTDLPAWTGLTADPESMDGPDAHKTHDLEGWDPDAEPWTTAANLEFVLRWAGVNVGSIRTAKQCHEQGWDPAAVRSMWNEGLTTDEDYREAAAMFRMLGDIATIQRVRPILDEIREYTNFSTEETIEWFDSDLGQWLVNHPGFAASLHEAGWTRDAILAVAHQCYSSNGERDFGYEVLLWEKTMARLPYPWRDLISVSAPVTAGLTRADAYQQIMDAIAVADDDPEDAGISTWIPTEATEGQVNAVDRLLAPWQMLAGLRTLSPSERVEALPFVPLTPPTTVPRRYERQYG